MRTQTEVNPEYIYSGVVENVTIKPFDRYAEIKFPTGTLLTINKGINRITSGSILAFKCNKVFGFYYMTEMVSLITPKEIELALRYADLEEREAKQMLAMMEVEGYIKK